jgi:hypothetical protein
VQAAAPRRAFDAIGHQVAHVDLVAQLDLQLLEHPAAGEGISIEALSDSTVNSDCSTDGVAHLDQQLDHGHVLEVADIGHAHLDGALLQRSGCGRSSYRWFCFGFRCFCRGNFGRLGASSRSCFGSSGTALSAVSSSSDHAALLDLVAQLPPSAP